MFALALWDEGKRRNFLNLLRYSKNSDPSLKKEIYQEATKAKVEDSTIEDDCFELMASWEYAAILEMLDFTDPSVVDKLIAEKAELA